MIDTGLVNKVLDKATSLEEVKDFFAFLGLRPASPASAAPVVAPEPMAMPVPIPTEISLRPKMTRRRWTESEKTTLAVMAENKTPLSDMARVLSRTESAISSALFDNNLPSPVRQVPRRKDQTRT